MVLYGDCWHPVVNTWTSLMVEKLLGTLACSHRDFLGSSLIRKRNWLWLDVNDTGLVIGNRKKIRLLISTGLGKGDCAPDGLS